MEQPRLGMTRGALIRKLFIALPLELLSVCAILFLSGCAAPGAPIARQPAVAEGINDLAAQQSGNSIVLTFTLPKETLQGNPLHQAPEIKIYREFLPAAPGANGNATPLPAPGQLILNLAPQAAAQYREGNRMRIPTPLNASDISSHAGQDAVYMARTRISTRDSADSNFAEVLVLPPPLPVKDLRAQVTQSAIELAWTPPQAPAVGALGQPAIRYRVYRTQSAPTAAASGTSGGAEPNTSAATMELLGETSSPSFSDTNFAFGEAYEYIVRSVARYDVGEVESEATEPLRVTPRDTFPPAAPQGLVAALVPASGGEPQHVDLSWQISPENDVAGYDLYRSEVEGAHGERINSQLLPTPTFRDISVQAGHRYFYQVTAVDRYGNESAPSAAVAVALPEASEQEKR